MTMNTSAPADVLAYGYSDADRARIVSALQSARDRMASALPKAYGEGWDGDLDTMLEAINYMKRCKQPVLRVFNVESQNARLRALLIRLIDIEGTQPGTAEWADDVRKELRCGHLGQDDNAAVGVLAVLDAEISRCNEVGFIFPRGRKLSEARAAVAELVAEFRQLIADADDSGITAHYKGRGFDESIERGRAALAKFA